MKLIIGGITTTPYDHTAHWVIYHRLSLQKEQRKLLDLIKDVVLRWGKGHEHASKGIGVPGTQISAEEIN